MALRYLAVGSFLIYKPCLMSLRWLDSCVPWPSSATPAFHLSDCQVGIERLQFSSCYRCLMS